MTEQTKQEVRRRFSRAAASYDAHAHLQRALAGRLAASLADFPLGPGRILELGCGTGNLTAILVARYPEARIFSLDFSETMLKQARRKLINHRQLSLICADAEDFLRGCRQSFDLICANATIQWFDAPHEALAEIARLLPEGGSFRATLFGPRSFQELGRGLTAVYGVKPSLASERFAEADALRASLTPLFGRVSLVEEESVHRYRSLSELLTQIRRTGTGGGHSLPTPLTRGRLIALDTWFAETFAGYPASFQIFTLRCVK